MALESWCQGLLIGIGTECEKNDQKICRGFGYVMSDVPVLLIFLESAQHPISPHLLASVQVWAVCLHLTHRFGQMHKKSAFCFLTLVQKQISREPPTVHTCQYNWVNPVFVNAYNICQGIVLTIVVFYYQHCTLHLIIHPLSFISLS